MRAPLRIFAVTGCVALAPLASSALAAAPAHPAPAHVASAAPRAMVMHFIEDDYAAALRQARAEKKPIFIEAWAPW